MQFTTLVTAALACVSGAVAATSSSPCPFNYPSRVNTTTSREGLTFNVVSLNPQINNRALQLVPNPFVKGGFFVGVDNSSSVLLANFRKGGVFSQARGPTNQLADLGPTAYLNLQQKVNSTSKFTVGFANASVVSTNKTGVVDTDWILSGGPFEGTYSWFHQVPVNVVNGFIICRSEVTLPNNKHFYQLFYETNNGTEASFPSCENIGIRTTVAPTIENGKCNIGGFTA